MQALTPAHAIAPGPAAPSPEQPTATDHHPDPLHEMDEHIARFLGDDMRLIYGMVVPIALVFELILILVLSPSYWLVGGAVAVEVGCLVLVITKLLAMLGEDGDDELGA